MFNFLGLFGHREIDEWRDGYTLMAAATLNEAAGNLIASFEEDLKSLSLKETLLGQRNFIATRVSPRVREFAGPVIDHIVGRANEALAQIIEYQAIWKHQPISASVGDDGFEGWGDIAVAAGPLAGGVAVAAALPSMAVTTSTAFLGLVVTTTISWPVLIGGSAFAGIAIAGGVLNTARMRDRAKARLRRRVHDYVVAALLHGSPKEPSILQQLGEALSTAASQAKKF